MRREGSLKGEIRVEEEEEEGRGSDLLFTIKNNLNAGKGRGWVEQRTCREKKERWCYNIQLERERESKRNAEAQKRATLAQ